MQYKIPVQIENEDPIVLGLSLRQLTIIMIGGGIAYSIFKGLAPDFGTEIAAIPSVMIGLTAVIIAIFKYSEMTFVPFILAFIRYKVNLDTRKWVKGVDSFSSLDIGFVSSIEDKKDDKVDIGNKMDKIKNLEDKLNKI